MSATIAKLGHCSTPFHGTRAIGAVACPANVPSRLVVAAGSVAVLLWPAVVAVTTEESPSALGAPVCGAFLVGHFMHKIAQRSLFAPPHLAVLLANLDMAESTSLPVATLSALRDEKGADACPVLLLARNGGNPDLSLLFLFRFAPRRLFVALAVPDIVLLVEHGAKERTTGRSRMCGALVKWEQMRKH